MFSFGQQPSLHNLLRPSPAFVRLLRRYYAAVRLPATVHLGLIAHRLRPAVRVRLPTDGNGVSRFSRVEFLCMHGVSDSAGRGALALSHAVMLSSGQDDTVDSLIGRFRSSQLRDTQPTYAPSQRFRNALAGRPAWFGVKMVATPFLYGSFIHNSTPVYPDANHPFAFHPNVSLVHPPRATHGSREPVPAFLEFRTVLLHPAQNSRVRQIDAALAHHRHKVAIAQFET